MQSDENLSMEVRQAKGSNEMESELGWGEIDRHGTDSEVGNFLMNNDQTYDFGELADAMDAEVYKAFGKEQVTRKVKGKSERPIGIFLAN